MKPEKPTDATDLRRRAQARLGSQTPAAKVPDSPEELQRLVQELQVYQTELEMQNEAVEESRARLEALAARYIDIYDFAPVSYFSLDLKRKIIQSNLAGARLLGLERSRLLDYRFDAFVASADLPAFRTLLTKVFATQSPEATEVRLTIKDKPPLAVLLQACVSADGRESHLVLTDITERKQAAEALRAETARRRILFEQLPDGILIIDPQTARFLEFNTAAHRQLGYSREEFAQLTIRDVESQETASETKARIGGVIQKGRADFETLQRTRQGEVRNVQVTAQLLDVEGQRLYQCVWRDITERKQAEEALSESQTRLRAITDSAQDAILMMNPEGGISYWNPAAERIFGYTSVEAIGQNLHALLAPPGYYEAHQAALPEFWQCGQGPAVGKTIDLEGRRKDGQNISLQLSLSAVQMEGRWHAVGVLRDIMAQKEAEKQLQQTNQSLEMANARAIALAGQADAANRAKSEFVANMSHEIRTPMNGVMGMTELLLKTKLDGRQTEFAEAIAQSAQALLQVIDDVLDLSKVEAGKITIISEEFSVRSVLDGVLEVAGHREPEKGISLAGILHHDAPDRVKGDPQRLRQVLLNLVGNAIKFTRKGEVTVRVQPVSGSGDRGVLRFEVKDTGIGMTAEQVKGLFQRFVQAEETTSRRFGGTGLGLAISRRLVELMGGSIGVQSEPGKGSTFWCELPFGPADQPALDGSHPALALAQVVLGIQHAGLAESLREQCRSWGVGCATAGTARELVGEAESAVGRKQTAVVVCEDEFFVAGGANLRQELSRLGQEVCCLLLASPANALAQEAEALNPFRRVLLKPVKQSHLFNALVTAVEGKDWQIVTSRVEPAADAADDGRVSRLRILLAEDHPINRKLSLLVLAGLGAAADTAEDGLQVMAAVTRQDYDVILMDCNMPEMDGYEATQKIRQLEESRGTSREKRTRIVALTANALAEDRERCLAGGMDDFLSKPFTAAELRGALLRCVGTEDASPVAAATGSRLDQLAAELDRESVALMIEDYIKDLPVRLAALKCDLADGKREEVERTAHSLKGVSAQFGLEDLSASFGAIEDAAETGDLERAREHLKLLGATAQAAAAAVRQWLRKS